MESNDASMNSSFFPRGLTRSWPLLALLVIAAVWLHRTPYSASNLEIPPDTVEYALAPLQFLETGRYEIMVEGRGLPPRYPPWFPILVILPAYVLFGHEPGNAILPITLLAVAGIGFAYAIGKRISSTTGGVLAALAVLIDPSYSRWTTQVMTDVPCAALMLGACLVYLHLREQTPSSASLFRSGGSGRGDDSLSTGVCRHAAAILAHGSQAKRERRPSSRTASVSSNGRRCHGHLRL